MGPPGQNLFLRQTHLRRDVGQHRGRVEMPAQSVPGAAQRDLCTQANGVLHQRVYLVHRRGVDEWAQLRIGRQARAHFQCGHGGHQFGGEGVVDTVVHQQAVRAHAGCQRFRYFEAKARARPHPGRHRQTR